MQMLHHIYIYMCVCVCVCCIVAMRVYIYIYICACVCVSVCVCELRTDDDSYGTLHRYVAKTRASRSRTGRDLGGRALDGSARRRWTFADLLRHVHDAEGIERIRFATSHPRYFTERLIQTLAELPKVCKYFHVPFQSGNDKVLREMRRGYSREKFVSIVHKIREYMPDASVSADAIVGFPGETEEEFMDTITLIEELQLDQVNTAAYSPRPDTPAAVRPDQVADLIKADRLQRINRTVAECAWNRSQRYLGRVERVLVEELNKRKEGQVMGRCDGFRQVFFDGDESLIGQFVDVYIDEAKAFHLIGHPV